MKYLKRLANKRVRENKKEINLLTETMIKTTAEMNSPYMKGLRNKIRSLNYENKQIKNEMFEINILIERNK